MNSERKSFDLASELQELRDNEKALQASISFLEYFNNVLDKPELARLSHKRVYDMIILSGSETSKQDGKKSYKFFEKELFGLEDPIQQLVDYFASAAKRLEVRKRILLLMGPVGGGKSTLVSMLKRGLERYTKTEEGAVYAIEDCPMHEEPLHLIPDELRPAIFSKHGVYIEGDLCPACRVMVGQKYSGLVENVKVERIKFSEKNRIGVGTFSPSDPKSQDISELTGSIDLATVGEYGSESDPRAYRFDGELNIANRGMMEFIEMLKADEKFLYHLLTLSQEQNIKTGRFAMIYADEIIISHTNEAEYTNFVTNRRNEALHDRIILIKVPYNLRVSEEVKIYDKLIRQSDLKNVHIAPNTLKTASIFAILSRLEPSKKAGVTIMKKLKIYDGEDFADLGQKDVRELKDEAIREGMGGISPRYVINSLSQALAREGTTCINPIDAMRAMRDGLDHYPGMDKDKKEQYMNLLAESRHEYDEWAKNEISKAFVYSFEDSAKTLLDNYLDNVEAFCNKTKLRDPISQEELAPDEKLMRSVEEQIGVSENAKKAFRDEILIKLSSLARKGLKFEYTSHNRLKEAIEQKLFKDLKDIIRITTSTKTPNPEQTKRFNDVAHYLASEKSYCNTCANELLKYVGGLLNR